MESLSYLTAKFFEPHVICAKPGGTCNRIVDTIRFLKRNFNREEQVMDVIDYPEAFRHKEDHRYLLRKLTILKRRLVCSGYDNAVLFDMLRDWQNAHISRFDEPLGRFLREFEINSAMSRTH